MKPVSHLALLVAVSAVAFADTQAAGVRAASVSTDATSRAGPSDRALCGEPARHGMRCGAHVLVDASGGRLRSAGPHRMTSASTAGSPAVPYSAVDLQRAYGLPQAGSSTSVVVGVVDVFGDTDAEHKLGVFRSDNGMPACTTANGCFSKLDEHGGQSYPPQPSASSADFGWVGETDLDLQAVSAACPTCPIVLVEAAANSSSDLFGAALSTLEARGVTVISLSFGETEADAASSGDRSSYDPLFGRAGVAVIAASGDFGYEGGVSWPAASPDVTAVGGTTLRYSPASARGWTESVWNESGGNRCGVTQTQANCATGSGCSAAEPKPAWQHDTGCARRTLNDVSADADPFTGLAVYTTQTDGSEAYNSIAGTSLSTPLVAAIIALRGGEGQTTGAQPWYSAAPVNDIASGNDITTTTTVDCSTKAAYLYCAGPGYDGPTGLGTPAGGLAAVALPSGMTAGYVLDGDGTLQPVTGSPAVTGGGFWPNWNISRGAALCPTDPLSGYLLEGWGGVHPFGAGGHVPPAVNLGGYWQGWDIARGIVVRPDCKSGYVLDGWGGIHPFGASGYVPPGVALGGYWPGWDIARDIVLNPADPLGGYVLEGWGGVHPFGQSGHVPPPVNLSGYWPGWDIARGLALAPSGQTGYVVEGWGGVHPVSTGGVPAAPSITGYSPGHDTFRRIAMFPGSTTEAYTVDTAGRAWPVAGAPILSTPGLTPATLMGRGLAIG